MAISYSTILSLALGATAVVAQSPVHRLHTHAESATCYARRYPDLSYHYCNLKGECDVHALHDHFRNNGRNEGRHFGCDADRNKFTVT